MVSKKELTDQEQDIEKGCGKIVYSSHNTYEFTCGNDSVHGLLLCEKCEAKLEGFKLGKKETADKKDIEKAIEESYKKIAPLSYSKLLPFIKNHPSTDAITYEQLIIVCKEVEKLTSDKKDVRIEELSKRLVNQIEAYNHIRQEKDVEIEKLNSDLKLITGFNDSNWKEKNEYENKL
jgi:hypothetical protein